MTIFIDNRGKGELELAELLRMKKIPVEIKHLESGDIVFWYGEQSIGIERKTINDLIGSVTSGSRRLWEQLKILKDTYNHPIVLIEGHIDYKDRLICSIIQSIVIGWKIPFLNTTNVYESAEIVSKIHDKYGSSKVNNIPPACVKKATSVKEIRWNMFQCVSRIGSKGATQLLELFPNFGASSYSGEYINKSLQKVKYVPTKSKEILKRVMCE